jgi:phosphoribosylformylglycinamidine cyclo-ligase
MPGMYPGGEYDLAGFAVGVVEKSKIIDGSTITEGDVLLGLASSGAHSNGYSLIRKIVETKKADLSTMLDGKTLGQWILAPTRIYVKPLLDLMKSVTVKGMAHITGGGLIENVPRVLPDGVCAQLDRSTWSQPPLFKWLQAQGNITDHEMHRVFNCGIGMVVIVNAADAATAMTQLRKNGETVWQIGTIVRRAEDAPQTVVA